MKFQARINCDVNRHLNVRSYRYHAEIVVAKSEIVLWLESELELHWLTAERRSKESTRNTRKNLGSIEQG